MLLSANQALLPSRPALDSGPHRLEHESVQPRPHDWRGQGSQRARNPLEPNVGDDGISRPLPGGLEPVDELRVEPPLELFQPDLVGETTIMMLITLPSVA